MKRIVPVVLIVLLLLSMLSGCTTTGTDDLSVTDGTVEQEGSEDGATKDVQEFVFGSSNDMVTLDVSKMNEEMSALVMYAVNEGLMRYSQGEIANGIAEDYAISDDGITYTFYLRDAVWSDGEPVTAYDFEYSFLRTLDPETGSSQVDSFDSILNAKEYYNGEITDSSKVGVKALDEKTLELTLTKSDPFFLSELAQGINFYPIRQDYVEKYGADYGSSPDNFIGCGPFKLTEWVQSASITMEKNELYWDKDNIKLEKVTNLIVPDENTLVGMYDLGEVDAVYSISATQTKLYTDYGNRTGGTLQYLCFNSRADNVLNNKNLRKALSYAIDRQAIVTAIASPGSEVADNMVDPSIVLDSVSIAEKYPNTTGISPEGDEEKALEYLEKALDELGFSSTEDLPNITYVCMDSAVHRQYAEALQEKWAETLNINVELSIMPVPQAIGSLLSGEFDIFLVSQSTGVNPDTILKNFTIGNGNNYSGWENEEYTQLIKLQADNNNLEERLKQLQQAEAMILDEAPVTPLLFPGNAYLSKDYVKNLNFGRQTGSIQFIYSYIE